MTEILETSALNTRLERIEEALYIAGLLVRPTPPAPPVEPPLVPCKILVQPFRGAASHPYSVYLEFDCPHCRANNKLTVFVPGRGVVKVVCVCKQFARVDLQWERT